MFFPLRCRIGVDAIRRKAGRLRLIFQSVCSSYTTGINAVCQNIVRTKYIENAVKIGNRLIFQRSSTQLTMHDVRINVRINNNQKSIYYS